MVILGEGIGGVLQRFSPGSHWNFEVKLSVEEVRRDDLNLDQFAAKAEQGEQDGQIEVRNISWAF